MVMPQLRIYLTGRVSLEAGTRVYGGDRFPGRQGRLLFAYLVCHRAHPVPRDELAEVLWSGEPPAAWDVALSALVSKLRALLAQAGLPPAAASITSHRGLHQMRLPPDAWIDLEAAGLAADEADGALRTGDLRGAWGPANVAVAICRRPFLPGAEGAWAEAHRQRLHALLVRGLDALSEISLRNGELALAVLYAGEAATLEPFRETGYERLMRIHAAMGNRAEALRVYERCRRLLVSELGTPPSAQLETLYLQLLRLPPQ